VLGCDGFTGSVPRIGTLSRLRCRPLETGRPPNGRQGLGSACVPVSWTCVGSAADRTRSVGHVTSVFPRRELLARICSVAHRIAPGGMPRSGALPRVLPARLRAGGDHARSPADAGTGGVYRGRARLPGAEPVPLGGRPSLRPVDPGPRRPPGPAAGQGRLSPLQGAGQGLHTTCRGRSRRRLLPGFREECRTRAGVVAPRGSFVPVPGKSRPVRTLWQGRMDRSSRSAPRNEGSPPSRRPGTSGSAHPYAASSSGRSGRLRSRGTARISSDQRSPSASWSRIAPGRSEARGRIPPSLLWRPSLSVGSIIFRRSMAELAANVRDPRQTSILACLPAPRTRTHPQDPHPMPRTP
jgi:hypothetical protein